MSPLISFITAVHIAAVYVAAQNDPSASDITAEATRLVQLNLDLQNQIDANDIITPIRVKSGRIPTCDDAGARTNLTVDWDGNPSAYQCDGYQWPASYSKQDNKYWCEPYFPRTALHFCLKDSITYAETLPTSGNHRPTWPTFGEYRFVPTQRWLHTAEHGGIVMLYHPCANPGQVDKLRKLVTGCLRRHVITAFNKLDQATPLALVSWGCKLVMGDVDEAAVKDFIKNRAKRGPEQMSINGRYTRELIRQSEVVPGSDFEDTNLCPT